MIWILSSKNELPVKTALIAWSLAGSYDLPFGRGKTYATDVNKWANLAIGGWTINAIYTYQLGAPLHG